MIEKLIPLDLPPGIFRNGTKYQAKNRWYDAHLVRWVEGALQPVGGWSPVRDTTGAAIVLVGKPRGAHTWRGNDGGSWLAFGTHSKAYGYSSGTLTDITPAGLVVGAIDGSYTTGQGNYGNGASGFGLYGSGSTASYLTEAATWSLDNYGDFLVGCLTGDGKLYSWDRNPVNDFAQMAGSPIGCIGLVVTPEGFLFSLGAGSDLRLVKWPSQATLTDWVPSSANSAGSFPLRTAGRLLAGASTARETLLWTDVDLWVATYIGGQLIYAFERRGDNCGLIAPNAQTVIGGKAYWMSHKGLFVYDGVVRPITCDVADYVFPRLNASQRAKVIAVPMAQYDEVWWYYPSIEQGGLENDSYLAFNYKYGYCHIGKLGRSAGVGGGATPNPVLVDATGNVYEHEVGQDRGAEIPYIESGPMEIGDGDRLAVVQYLLPDEKTTGDVAATFYVSNAPEEAERCVGPYTITSTTPVRFTARQARVRYTQQRQTSWRVGLMRLGAMLGGRR